MEEKILVKAELGREYISKERKLAILIGAGYVLLIFVLGMTNGLIALDVRYRLSLLLAFVALGIFFGLKGFYKKDSKEIKAIKHENFLLDEEYGKELKQKYDKVKPIYRFIYFASILGVLAIIGRSLYIVMIYRACPRNDITVFSFGGLAMFCFSYASGVIGAYKHLLKGGRRGEV